MILFASSVEVLFFVKVEIMLNVKRFVYVNVKTAQGESKVYFNQIHSRTIVVWVSNIYEHFSVKYAIFSADCIVLRYIF